MSGLPGSCHRIAAAELRRHHAFPIQVGNLNGGISLSVMRESFAPPPPVSQNRSCRRRLSLL